MLRKINKALRTTVIIAGAVIIASELIREFQKEEKIEDEMNEADDDFQKEEFDDIW